MSVCQWGNSFPPRGRGLRLVRPGHIWLALLKQVTTDEIDFEVPVSR